MARPWWPPDLPSLADLRAAVTPRRALGGVAGGSLLTGLPGLWSRRAPALVDSDAVGLLGVVVTNYFVETTLLSHALSWFLVLGIVYVYVDDIYLERAMEVTERRGFRLLATAATGGFAFPLVAYQRGSFENGTWLVAGVAVACIAFLAFGAYFRLSSLDLYMPEGVISRVMTEFARVDPGRFRDERRKATGWYRTFLVATHAVAAGTVFALPCLVMGLVTVVLVQLYPLPELIVLLGISAAAIQRLSFLDRRLPERGSFDIETRLYRLLEGATRNLKGTLLAMLCLVNASGYGVMFVGGLEVARTVLEVFSTLVIQWSPSTPGTLDLEGVLTLHVLVGTAAGVLVAGVYGVTFWLWELRRIPAYARDWEARYDGAEPPTGEVRVARIPGLLLPGYALLSASLAAAAYLPPVVVDATPAVVGFALAWPVLVGVCTWTVVYATKRTPQPVSGESAVIAGATLLLLVAAAAGSLLVGSEGDTPATTLLAFGALCLLVLLVVWLPELERLSRRRETDTLIVAVLVGALLLAGGIVYLYFPAGTTIVLVFVVVLALAVVVDEFLHRRR